MKDALRPDSHWMEPSEGIHKFNQPSLDHATASDPRERALEARVNARKKPRQPTSEKSRLESLFYLHCHAHKLTPEREYRFHPERRWKFDFAWPDKKVAVDLQGGTWSGGAHVRGGGYQRDCDKHNAATLMNWRVYRYTAADVTSARAILQVKEALGG